MFTKPPKKPEPTPAIHTILGQETLFNGEIHTGTRSLRIEGRVEGIVHSQGEIIVAPTGVIHGTVHAKHLIVTGRVEGVAKVEECLEIHGTGFVEGEVEVGSLVVDEGGTLQGTCSRRGTPQPVPTIVAPREEEAAVASEDTLVLEPLREEIASVPEQRDPQSETEGSTQPARRRRKR